MEETQGRTETETLDWRCAPDFNKNILGFYTTSLHLKSLGKGRSAQVTQNNNE